MSCVVNATLRPLYRRARNPVSTVQEEGWAPGPDWTDADTLAPRGFDPRTVQPVASPYTHWKENHKTHIQDAL